MINVLAFMAIPAGIAWALLLPKQFAAVIAAGGGPWIFVLLVMAYLFGFIPGTEGWALRIGFAKLDRAYYGRRRVRWWPVLSSAAVVAVFASRFLGWWGE